MNTSFTQRKKYPSEYFLPYAKLLSCGLNRLNALMGVHIKFAPELGHWITNNLNRQCKPEDLVAGMVAQKFDPQVASGIVHAFVHARERGLQAPVDSVEIDSDMGSYRCEPARINWTDAHIQTFDRTVPVVARFQRPIAAIFGSVLSDAECEQVIALARPRLTPSTIVDPATGQDIATPNRDSEGMFFRLNESPLIATLDRRLSELMNAPIENGEGMQVLRYGPGAKNTPHYDALVPTSPASMESIARSGNRISTLLVYLNNVPQGGETAFPEAGLVVAAQRGNAVYFESTNSLRQIDPLSVHTGAPVRAGEKWALVKWMREKPFKSQ